MVIFFIPNVHLLLCYNCTSQLPSQVSKEGQLSLKYLLYTNFNIPPVNEYCGYENDNNFQYQVPLESCNDNDECVKIVSKSEDLRFVIRGCRKKIFKKYEQDPNKEIKRGNIQDKTCQESINPIVCGCYTDQCNTGNLDIDKKLYYALIIAFIIYSFI